MSRSVWRIAADTPLYKADDLSGTGAEASGGRWNEPGAPVVYTSETRSLACLETVVHLNAGGLPLTRYLVEISIPDDLWVRAHREIDSTLPTGWNADPAGRASQVFGTEWLSAGANALLIVPSVIVPEESNVLINPRHPDSRAISAAKSRRWLYDPRLVRPV